MRGAKFKKIGGVYVRKLSVSPIFRLYLQRRLLYL